MEFLQTTKKQKEQTQVEGPAFNRLFTKRFFLDIKRVFLPHQKLSEGTHERIGHLIWRGLRRLSIRALYTSPAKRAPHQALSCVWWISERLYFCVAPCFFFENQGAAFPVEQTWWSYFKVQTWIILRWLDSEQHIWKCVLYMWHQHFCHTSLRTYAQYFSPLFDQKSQFHLRNWSLDTWSTSEFICYAAMLSTNSYSLGFGRLEWWMFPN